MDHTILFDSKHPIAVLTLNRPKALNSFNEQMHAEVNEALDLCEKDEKIKVLILTATGRAFCAGQDLGDRQTQFDGQSAPDLGLTIQKYYNPLVRRLVNFPKPTVGAVNGIAAGAGANLALATDIVVAAQSAAFVQSFSRVGLVPDSGGTWQLTRAIGLPRARAMAMLGEKISATQAQEWGMIYQVVEDDKLSESALALGQTLLERAPLALQQIKSLLLQACHGSLDEQLEKERLAMQKLGRSQDYKEGVNAFLNKRSPEFKGQ